MREVRWDLRTFAARRALPKSKAASATFTTTAPVVYSTPGEVSRFFVDASIESIPMRCQSYCGPLSLTGTTTPVKFHLKLKEQSPLLTRPHWRDTSFFK